MTEREREMQKTARHCSICFKHVQFGSVKSNTSIGQSLTVGNQLRLQALETHKSQTADAPRDQSMRFVDAVYALSTLVHSTTRHHNFSGNDCSISLAGLRFRL